MTFKLSDITDPPPTTSNESGKRLRQPVYQHEVYLAALEKNYKECGVPFDRADFEPITQSRAPSPERADVFESPPMDRIYLKLRCTKNRVHVKIDTSLYDLHQKYYAQGKAPPFRSLAAAYKSMGFPKSYIERLERGKHRAKEIFQNPKLLKLLETPKKKKPSKKAKKEEVVAVTTRHEEDDAVVSDSEASDSETPSEDDEGYDVTRGDEETLDVDDHTDDDEPVEYAMDSGDDAV
tara:strand:- start:657 stop:1364 length:708 start_codon:yes stop_codon:yes gene_type:complete